MLSCLSIRSVQATSDIMQPAQPRTHALYLYVADEEFAAARWSLPIDVLQRHAANGTASSAETAQTRVIFATGRGRK